MRKTATKCCLLMACTILFLEGCGETEKHQGSADLPVPEERRVEARWNLRAAFHHLQARDVVRTNSSCFMVTDNRNGVELACYESVEAFLEEAGFASTMPFFQYFDEDSGALQLVLYYNECDGTGGGVCYYPNQEKKRMPEGFLFHSVDKLQPGDTFLAELAERVSADPYALISAYGYDPRDADLDQEQMDCLEDGRPLHYLARGNVCYADLECIVKIDWEYRGDGSLKQRSYYHNNFMYDTLVGNYDAQGRVVYEQGYITHGSLEYYYIYSKDRATPDYYLYIDHNLDLLCVEFLPSMG